MFLYIFCIFSMFGASFGHPVHFTALRNHQIWTISSPNPITSPIIAEIHRLEEDAKLDILSLSRSDSRLRVYAETLEEVRQRLEGMGAVVEVLVTDVAKYLWGVEKEQFPLGSVAPQRSALELPVDSYMIYAEIEAYLDAIAVANPLTVKKESIGKTFENRDIWMMTIKSDTVEPQKSIFLEGGIHAREWISPAVTLYLIDMLVNNICELGEVEFRIVPVANPDGYIYSHTTDRFWRKNRRDNSGSSCFGVDLNRNWDFQFGGTGSSGNPCSQVYRGTTGFSEPETTAVSDAMRNTPNLILVLAIHSYGQLMLYPWGYTVTDAPNKDMLKATADEFATAVRNVNGATYRAMSGADLYPAAGATDDWAYGELGVKYSYTLELRDTGSNGFELPVDQIDPTRKEIWAGLKLLIEKVNNECS